MKKVILHCSDSSYGNSAVVDHWHRQRGFKGIGYHFVILNGRITSDYTDDMFDGTIETGRSYHQHGAHTKYHNESCGICLIGKSGQFTDKQLDSLIYLIKHIEDMEDEIFVYQHSEFDKNKPFCAGLKMDMFKQWRP